jgi:carbamoyl-phosphate synthase large subunit
MKSVGEAMGIGRTFKESFQKAILSLEKDNRGLEPVETTDELLATPSSRRIYHVIQAFRDGKSLEEIHRLTEITPWFLQQFSDLVEIENEIRLNGKELESNLLRKAKRSGFSDAAISSILNIDESVVKLLRDNYSLYPAYFQVDTCAGEFFASTPYYYSTYWSKNKNREANKKATAVLLGSGPNRIGQAIEFDYSCVRGVWELQKQGYHVVMINSNPETVSTDYDTANELFFEPLTSESVLEVMRFIQPDFFISQLGGQTPINLASTIVKNGIKMLGSSVESMDLAEDRAQFIAICKEFGFKIPRSAMVHNKEKAIEIAREYHYPLMCRPSYVLGGRRMEIVENQDELESYFNRHSLTISESAPCLIDQFLDRALEVDVDLVRGKDWIVIGGIVEHIEAAGVHSGDSMGVIPPQRLKNETLVKIESLSKNLAERMNVIGFLNLQLAVKNDEIYMIEANPRSSRSMPFISKATGIPLIDLGIKSMLGKTKDDIPELKKYLWQNLPQVSVKGVVFPFKKFAEADSILGPEMKSTGESMGRGKDYAEALYKAYLASGFSLPLSGEVFLSLREKDKKEMLELIRELKGMGFTLSATSGTAQFLGDNGIECVNVRKVHEGRPNCVDRIRSGKVDLVINTTSGKVSIEASFGIRRSCVDYFVPCLTESDAAKAFIIALRKRAEGTFSVSPLNY